MRTIPALLVLLLAGCTTTTTPNYDLRFGAAVRDAKLRQTLDPQASQRPATPTGLDGEAAAEALNRYHDSFKKPPPVVNVINIGGTTGGGSR